MSYVMSILFLPTTLIDVTKKMMNVLWWGHRGAINNGMQWLLWDKLMVHKNHDSMDFKDLMTFNLAMLGKQ